MNQEQLETLAAIVLTNQKRLDTVTDILVRVLEAQAQSGLFGGTKNVVLSIADQLAANSREAQKLLIEAHKFFGLDAGAPGPH